MEDTGQEENKTKGEREERRQEEKRGKSVTEGILFLINYDAD